MANEKASVNKGEPKKADEGNATFHIQSQGWVEIQLKCEVVITVSAT